MSQLHVVRYGHEPQDDPPTDVDDDDTDVKTTFAHFGLAFYQACVLEHQVVSMLVFSKLLEAEAEARKLLNDPWEEHFKETLGRLVRRFTQQGKADQQLVEDLTEAVRLRNHLGHAFWRERAEDFCSDAGRADMIAFLADARDLFIRVDEQLTELNTAQMKRHAGITKEMIDQQYQEMRARAEARDQQLS
ncbi:hypothetical protein CA850_02725 [Micromonospora echinospora]|uniref:Uncharacterized protein n=1 Tax=Micromonospora echinospora TaxID=1877 RepID=A0A1C5A4P8_MICEC|nr:hypothetical protein [Micromonospora echinospora]OZV83603.1 hypothetical protein CA850_02725 [Micromonospora echinospora]SCF40187.1 hypothetical protein GA0070618_6303 [Micromonospora echinospora]